jgi:transcriptional regulator with XRE-family HTH domain
MTVNDIDSAQSSCVSFQSPLDFSEDDLYKAIGERVRIARSRIGLTQEALGELIGLGRTSITNIERGRQRMSIHALYALAQALRLKPAALLPSPSPGPVPTLESVEGLTDEEREWIRTVVSPPTSTTGGDIASTA